MYLVKKASTKKIFLVCLVFILNHQACLGALFYNVPNSSAIDINEHGSCKNISNSSGKGLFVPTKTAGEWALVTSRLGLTVNQCGCASITVGDCYLAPVSHNQLSGDCDQNIGAGTCNYRCNAGSWEFIDDNCI